MTDPKIYYIRHGQTDWNAELRFQGQRDIPLNDTGRGQALHNGKTLKSLLENPAPYTFVSSPLSRARETMEIVRRELGLDVDKYETEDRLIEVSYGNLEGITQPEMKAADRELYYYRKQNAWTFRPEGGESHEDVIGRVSDWINSLRADGQYIVTAHGAVGRVMRHLQAGLSSQEASKFVFPQDKVFLFENGAELQF